MQETIEAPRENAGRKCYGGEYQRGDEAGESPNVTGEGLGQRGISVTGHNC